MVDLNKKPLPDPRENLVRVLAGIAKKREEEEREEIARELVESRKLIKTYEEYWVGGITVAVVFDVIQVLITMNPGSGKGLLGGIWTMFSYVWGILGSIAVTLILALIVNPGIVFSNDYPTVKIKGYWCKKIVYAILVGVPWYVCIITRFHVDPVKAIWIAPVSFILICVLTLFNNKAGNPMRLGQPTQYDYRAVRVNQLQGGLNPDRLPILMNSDNVEAIMRMNPQDWNYIGHQLSQAGYKNVLKKGR